MTRDELIASLEEKVEQIISLRLALDDGDLIFTKTMIYFIAERMDKWTIIEEWEQRGVSRWKLQEPFTGLELVIFTPDGRFLFRKVPLEINWIELFSESTQDETRQPKLEIKKEDASEFETKMSSQSSYGNVGQEFFDMPSKNVAKVNQEDVMDLAEILEKKRKRLSDSRNNASQKPVENTKRSFAKTIAPEKKKGCGGCITSIFWLLFIGTFAFGMLR
jgi:hypothetical protein